ncbi:NUDIX domain-containing protein [Halobaculum sp. D14]|uniref:NUDIX domain-containing protein n=1 Tax=unclassified Halobaculum TaxID=2640896 RepID=UPI003EBB2104
MTGLDDLWFLADEARQTAERAAHRLDAEYDDYLRWERSRTVSRARFRTLADRVKRTGAPFGAHTVVYRSDGDLLLVRHDGVDKWVVPGGGVRDDETFREAAERELAEEAGVDAEYDGLAICNRVAVACDDHELWGVLPVFAAEADPDATPEVRDPDDEISAASWFSTLPADTRDRADLQAWREKQGFA